MPPHPHARPNRPMRCALAAWLAVVLVAVNGLGAVHRVAHAGSFERIVAAGSEQAGVSGVGSLFESHADLGSCERYDQLSFGAAFACVAATLELPAPGRVLAARVERAAPTLRREAAQARGPPMAV